MIKPDPMPVDGSVEPAKKELSLAEREQRKLAANSSANLRRSRTQEKMAEKLEKLVDSVRDEDIVDSNFKEKMLGIGIMYDKLYRDNKAVNASAIQINIQTVGMDPAKVDPLLIDITPNKHADAADPGQ